MSLRPPALHEANALHAAFFSQPLPQTPPNAPSFESVPENSGGEPRNERICLGHRETIFGLSFSPDGKYLATASQDSSVKIWEVARNKLLHTLEASDAGSEGEFECLRVAWATRADGSEGEGGAYLVASAGADGMLRLWRSGEIWKSIGAADHREDSEEDRPQIYSLQFVPRPEGDLIMTSANDALRFWEYSNRSNISANASNRSETKPNKAEIKQHLAVRFDRVGSNEFGGPRNPENQIYVFDSSYNQNNECAAVALSDGSCRILSLPDVAAAERRGCDADRRGRCAIALPPGAEGHLTGVQWDSSGERFAACISSGIVVLWEIRIVMEGGRRAFYPSCVGFLSGGHDVGRPIFGARYYGGKNEELLLTHGVDGKVCLWDSRPRGAKGPLCTLISHQKYPIYALDIRKEGGKGCLAVGGGSDGGFLGVPVYLHDI